MTEESLSRQQISDAVAPLGWCLVEGVLLTVVPATSLAEAVRLAELAVTAVGEDGQGHLDADIRSDRIVLRLVSAEAGAVTRHDLRLAGHLSAALHEAEAPNVTTVGDRRGSLQVLEMAIDALDIGAVRPFWKAVTGYVDEASPSDMPAALVDPIGRGPAIWFQQMDAPRRQRNRIHVDVSVPHELAAQRLEAAIAAGGTLLSDERAPAFWVLADAEGNEVCICTWQGRD
jgi:4a-hydroxytetrahydrobiopterin dehydratase